MARIDWRRVPAPAAAMAAVVAVSNFLVQFPINDWLTWAAFTFPVSFLVTDLSNRAFGPGVARRVVLVGFAVGVALSIWLADVRIALASGTAFVVGQMLDVAIFDRMRRLAWWRAPLASSLVASAVDTLLFFSLAFAGTAVPWPTLAAGDYAAKLAMAALLLAPYRMVIRWLPVWRISPGPGTAAAGSAGAG